MWVRRQQRMRCGTTPLSTFCSARLLSYAASLSASQSHARTACEKVAPKVSLIKILASSSSTSSIHSRLGWMLGVSYESLWSRFAVTILHTLATITAIKYIPARSSTSQIKTSLSLISINLRLLPRPKTTTALLRTMKPWPDRSNNKSTLLRQLCLSERIIIHRCRASMRLHRTLG